MYGKPFAGCTSLAAGMRSSTSLSSVDLSLNQLGPDAGRALAGVLVGGGWNLTVLKLWRNRVDDIGAQVRNPYYFSP